MVMVTRLTSAVFDLEVFVNDSSNVIGEHAATFVIQVDSVTGIAVHIWIYVVVAMDTNTSRVPEYVLQ
jgi:hypothetical protein